MDSTAARFRALHQQTTPLLLPNAWDAGSARVIESAGAAAIATSSAALAWARGYADGGALPPSVLLAAVRDIARVLVVPLSVDIESGYGATPAEVAENARALASEGAVGVNLEDGTEPVETLCARIAAAKEGAARAGVNLFVNARTDVYLRGLAAPERALEETLARARRYRDAGADGLFVPGLIEPVAIGRIGSENPLPVNVLVRAGLPPVDALARLGVRRVSAGSGIASATYGLMRRATREFLEAGSYRAILDDAMGYDELQRLFGAA